MMDDDTLNAMFAYCFFLRLALIVAVADALAERHIDTEGDVIVNVVDRNELRSNPRDHVVATDEEGGPTRMEVEHPSSAGAEGGVTDIGRGLKPLKWSDVDETAELIPTAIDIGGELLSVKRGH